MNKYKDIGQRPVDLVPRGRRASAEFVKDRRTRVPPARGGGRVRRVKPYIC